MKYAPLIFSCSLLALLSACRTQTSPTPPSIPVKPASVPVASSEEHYPESGYTWFELAQRAVVNNWEIESLTREAQAERMRGIARATTRDPQLQLAYDRGRDHGWENRDNSVSQYDEGAMTWSGDNRRGNRSSLGTDYTTGGRVRIYTSNPFINRHIRDEGTGRAAELIGEAAAVKHDITETTLLLCIELERLQQEQKLAGEIESLRLDILNWTRASVESATLTVYELLREELALENLRTTNRERLIRIHNLRRELATLCAVPLEHLRLAPAALDLAALTARLSSPADLYNQAIANHPQLMIVRGLTQQAQAQLGAAQASRIPWLEYIDAGYSRGHASSTEYGHETNTGGTRLERIGINQHARDHEWEIRAAITIPLFSWFSAAGKEARLRLEAAQARETAILTSVYREVHNLCEDLKGALHTYAEASDAFERHQKRLNESLDVMREQTGFATDLKKLQIQHLETQIRLVRMEEHCQGIYATLVATLSRTTDMGDAL